MVTIQYSVFSFLSFRIWKTFFRIFQSRFFSFTVFYREGEGRGNSILKILKKFIKLFCVHNDDFSFFKNTELFIDKDLFISKFTICNFQVFIKYNLAATCYHVIMLPPPPPISSCACKTDHMKNLFFVVYFEYDYIILNLYNCKILSPD